MGPEFLSLVQAVGIPFATLVALAIAVWRALTWSATNVFKPLIDGHLNFLRQIQEGHQKQTDTLEQIAATQQQQAEALARITETLFSLSCYNQTSIVQNSTKTHQPKKG